MLNLIRNNFQTLLLLAACMTLMMVPVWGQTVTLSQTPQVGTNPNTCYVKFGLYVGEGAQPTNFKMLYTPSGSGASQQQEVGVPESSSTIGWYKLETEKLHKTGFNGTLQVEVKIGEEYFYSNSLTVDTIGCVTPPSSLNPLPGNAGTRMASNDDPPPILTGKDLQVKLLATLESGGEKKSDEKKVSVAKCPAKATLTGTISLGPQVKGGGALTYTIVGKGLTATPPLPPAFMVVFAATDSNGSSSNMRKAASQSPMLSTKREVAIPVTIWRLGANANSQTTGLRPKPLTGYLELVSLKPKPGGGYSVVETLGVVALTCKNAASLSDSK